MMTREQHLKAKVKRLRAALERLIVAAEDGGEHFADEGAICPICIALYAAGKVLEDVDETDQTARRRARNKPGGKKMGDVSDAFNVVELSECAAREATQRRRVYPRLVETGKIKREFA